MFQLYDRTRRQICIAAFFAFCVAPTLIVLSCGVWRHLPWQVNREAERLGVGRVATVIGRFWSLDREEHWDRIEKTYRMLVEGRGQPVQGSD